MMNKNRLFLLLCAMVCCMSAFAGNWHFGMQLGYNMGIEKTSQSISKTNDRNHGIYYDIEGMWRPAGDHGFGLSLGLGISYGEQKIRTLDNYNAELRYSTFYVPLHVSYTYLLAPNVSFMIYLGPSLRVPVDYNYTDVVAVDRYTIGNWWDGYETYTEEVGYRYDRVENHWEYNRNNWMGQDPTCPETVTNGKVFKKCDLGLDFGLAFNIHSFILTAKYTFSPLNTNANTYIPDKLYNDALKIGFGFLL